MAESDILLLTRYRYNKREALSNLFLTTPALYRRIYFCGALTARGRRDVYPPLQSPKYNHESSYRSHTSCGNLLRHVRRRAPTIFHFTLSWAEPTRCTERESLAGEGIASAVTVCSA